MSYRSFLIALLLSTAVALRSVDARNSGFKLFDRQQNSEGQGRLLVGKLGALTSTTIAPSALLLTSGPPPPPPPPPPPTSTWGPTTFQTSSITPTFRSAGPQPPATASSGRAHGEIDKDESYAAIAISPATAPSGRAHGEIDKDKSYAAIAISPTTAPTGRTHGQIDKDESYAGIAISPATAPTARDYEEEDFDDVNEIGNDEDENSLLAHDNEEMSYVSAQENSLAKAVRTIRVRPDQIKQHKASMIPNRRQQHKRQDLQKQQQKKRILKNRTINRRKQLEAENLKRISKKQRTENKLRRMRRRTLQMRRCGGGNRNRRININPNNRRRLRRRNTGRRSHIVRIKV